ncbi:alpha/beta hydrolase family protein [Hahella sp. NBU794]|uniref:alpha/beta hydrolase family protein n=1 Tax=Hahella sp. NBU794 TaxID=3422590 RepID=UPI003D6EA8CD
MPFTEPDIDHLTHTQQQKNDRGITLKKFSLLTSVLMFLTACADSLGWLSRPQDPKDRNYRVEQVRFQGGDADVTLAGELTMPLGQGPFPAIILITGSGPQDRNEAIAGHKPFLVLSDYLTRNGFAVLRYDDRGVGESTGAFSSENRWKPTLSDFAQDAAAAYRFMQNIPAIDVQKIGFLGHSEGGYIASAAAEFVPAAFMIFLAAPALPLLPDVMATQVVDIARSQGKSQQDIEREQALCRDLTEILRTSPSVADARNQIEKRLQSHGLTRAEIKANMEVWGSDWGRHYASYDPLPAFRRFKNPVLALFGGSDLQVSAAENAPIMKSVLTNPESEVLVLDKLNHLFQPSETGRIEDYILIDTTIDPRALNAISEWLSGIL